MANGTNIELDRWLGGPSLECFAACAGYGRYFVVRMNTLFHKFPPSNSNEHGRMESVFIRGFLINEEGK